MPQIPNTRRVWIFFYGVNSSNQNSLNGELYGKFHFLFSISGHRAEPIET